MRLSVIVPVRDDAARLGRCLVSLGPAGAGSETEVIVADNGSTDDSPRVARDVGARVLSLPGLTVPALRNAAASEASGDLLAFVDADHELAPGWVAGALETMQDDTVGAAGAKYTAPPGGTWVQNMYGLLRGRTTGRGETDWLGSGNMVVSREAFEKIGGFDASLEACEDVDLCRRLRQAGYTIIGDERLRSIHHGDPGTLRALFRAERWRGRDNLRVSLRGSVNWRDLPSIVIPVLTLAAILTLGVSLAVKVATGRPVGGFALAAAALILAIAAMRSVRMTAGLDRPSPLTVAKALVAALVYDAARAMALVGRAHHHRR
jgi:glycosyltransferase involved in cell wall biosynthesis